MSEIIKKRGRKKKDEPAEPIVASIEEDDKKRRGRKPKGGKLVARPVEEFDVAPVVENVILHLKCTMKDLNEYNTELQDLVSDPLTYKPVIPPTVITYNEPMLSNYFTYNQEQNQSKSSYDNQNQNQSLIRENVFTQQENENDKEKDDDPSLSMKDINQKMKKLRGQLFKNCLQDDKKSACFWCTYDYDNETCYIPKHEEDGVVCGYGSFCRPECAVAYLMKENIDDSTRFRRYEMLNNIYSKIYNFKKNIKPAPDPYYTLERFYGNLTIQEYRKLTKSEHMLLVIDKPMTRLLPELHEDNDDFVLDIYGGVKSTQTNTGVYKVKRQSEKGAGPSKSAIIQKNFGVIS